LTAAETENRDAQYILGHMLEHGKGVERNPVKAIEWYQKGMLSRILQNINTLSAFLSPAAEAGDVDAQKKLRWIFEFGKGVEWYQKGMLSRILQGISALLSAFLSPAAEAGDVDAQNKLGWIFELGKEVGGNLDKAFEWYRKSMLLRILQGINALNALLSPAAKAGDVDAKKKLRWMFEFGKGVEDNLVKAFEWYQKGMLSRILQNINALTQYASFASRRGRTERCSK
jgi:uncharacterized protein